MNKTLALLAMSILALAAPVASAQKATAPKSAVEKVFLEFGIGQAQADIDVSGFNVDDDSTTWTISGGWMFHPMVGVELGYRDLGEASASRGTILGTLRGDWEVDGFLVGAVGRIPVAPQFELVPRVGLYFWDLQARSTLNGNPLGSSDDDGSDIYFGVGLQYVLNRQFHLGAHWARYDIDGDDVDVFELRIGLRF